MTLEELQAEFLKQQEQLKQLTEDNNNYKNIIEEKTNREKELEEYNQQLFLKVANPIQREEKQNEKLDQIKDFIGATLYAQLSDKEIDVIKNILEGEDE